jgi:hypothetical protein
MTAIQRRLLRTAGARWSRLIIRVVLPPLSIAVRTSRQAPPPLIGSPTAAASLDRKFGAVDLFASTPLADNGVRRCPGFAHHADAREDRQPVVRAAIAACDHRLRA